METRSGVLFALGRDQEFYLGSKKFLSLVTDRKGVIPRSSSTRLRDTRLRIQNSIFEGGILMNTKFVDETTMGQLKSSMHAAPRVAHGRSMSLARSLQTSAMFPSVQNVPLLSDTTGSFRCAGPGIEREMAPAPTTAGEPPNARCR